MWTSGLVLYIPLISEHGEGEEKLGSTLPVEMLPGDSAPRSHLFMQALSIVCTTWTTRYRTKRVQMQSSRVFTTVLFVGFLMRGATSLIRMNVFDWMPPIFNIYAMWMIGASAMSVHPSLHATGSRACKQATRQPSNHLVTFLATEDP